MMPEQKRKRTEAQAENPQSSQQTERGSQDKARTLADKREVTGDAAVKQTMIPGEKGEQTDSSKPNDIRAQSQFKEVSNVKTPIVASNLESSLWSKEELSDLQRRIGEVKSHTSL